jgi:hypothetical protein
MLVGTYRHFKRDSTPAHGKPRHGSLFWAEFGVPTNSKQGRLAIPNYFFSSIYSITIFNEHITCGRGSIHISLVCLFIMPELPTSFNSHLQYLLHSYPYPNLHLNGTHFSVISTFRLLGFSSARSSRDGHMKS